MVYHTNQSNCTYLKYLSLRPFYRAGNLIITCPQGHTQNENKPLLPNYHTYFIQARATFKRKTM